MTFFFFFKSTQLKLTYQYNVDSEYRISLEEQGSPLGGQWKSLRWILAAFPVCSSHSWLSASLSPPHLTQQWLMCPNSTWLQRSRGGLLADGWHLRQKQFYAAWLLMESQRLNLAGFSTFLSACSKYQTYFIVCFLNVTSKNFWALVTMTSVRWKLHECLWNKGSFRHWAETQRLLNEEHRRQTDHASILQNSSNPTTSRPRHDLHVHHAMRCELRII